MYERFKTFFRRKWVKRVCLVFLFIFLLILLWFLYFYRPIGLPPSPPSYECLLCHKQEKGKVVHPPYGGVYCRSCHTTHGLGEKAKLVAPLKILCLSCHPSVGRQLTLNFVHMPVGKGFCLDCHKQHVSNYRDLLKEEPEELCLACHKFGKYLTLDYPHLPVEKRKCLSCHVAHGSKYDHGLIEQELTLCVSCHPSVGRLLLRPYKHLPIERNRCVDCHGPHGTGFEKLLYAEKLDFCFICHPSVAKLFQKISTHPLEEKFWCVNCHNPHADYEQYLLPKKGNALCYLCHKDIEKTYLGSDHDFVEWQAETGSCLNCHVPHGSDFPPLLLGEGAELCTWCHPTYANPIVNHPVGNLYKDELTGGTLTCTSSCHNPHGSKYRNMLTSLPDGLCLLCHPVSELP